MGRRFKLAIKKERQELPKYKTGQPETG